MGGWVGPMGILAKVEMYVSLVTIRCLLHTNQQLPVIQRLSHTKGVPLEQRWGRESGGTVLNPVQRELRPHVLRPMIVKLWPHLLNVWCICHTPYRTPASGMGQCWEPSQVGG